MIVAKKQTKKFIILIIMEYTIGIMLMAIKLDYVNICY